MHLNWQQIDHSWVQVLCFEAPWLTFISACIGHIPLVDVCFSRWCLGNTWCYLSTMLTVWWLVTELGVCVLLHWLTDRLTDRLTDQQTKQPNNFTQQNPFLEANIYSSTHKKNLPSSLPPLRPSHISPPPPSHRATYPASDPHTQDTTTQHANCSAHFPVWQNCKSKAFREFNQLLVSSWKKFRFTCVVVKYLKFTNKLKLYWWINYEQINYGRCLLSSGPKLYILRTVISKFTEICSVLLCMGVKLGAQYYRGRICWVFENRVLGKTLRPQWEGVTEDRTKIS